MYQLLKITAPLIVRPSIFFLLEMMIVKTENWFENQKYLLVKERKEEKKKLVMYEICYDIQGVIMVILLVIFWTYLEKKTDIKIKKTHHLPKIIKISLFRIFL
jgi:hypothetical protein